MPCLGAMPVELDCSILALCIAVWLIPLSRPRIDRIEPRMVVVSDVASIANAHWQVSLCDLPHTDYTRANAAHVPRPKVPGIGLSYPEHESALADRGGPDADGGGGDGEADGGGGDGDADGGGGEGGGGEAYERTRQGEKREQRCRESRAEPAEVMRFDWRLGETTGECVGDATGKNAFLAM